MFRKLILLGLTLVLLLGASFTARPTTQAQDEIEIVFTHIFPDERDVRRTTIREMADRFQELHPGVTVTILTTTDQYSDVFDGAIRGAEQGDGPHVVQIEDTLVQLAIDSGMFVPIDEYASEEQMALVNDILPNIRNFYEIEEGEPLWGLPWNASNPVFYINPAIFEAAGLDPNSPPTTFAEVTAACEAIMAAEIEGLEGCINWPVTSWMPEQWLAMQNALFMNNDNGRSDTATEAFFTSEAMLKIMNWWSDLADNGYYIYSGTPQAYTQEGLFFVSGRTAMHINSSAGISNIMKFGESMGKFTPIVLPLFRPDEDANNGMTIGGGSLMIMAGHSEEETQAAVDFAFFMLESENMKAWHKASGYFPVTQTAITELEAEGWFEENPYYEIPLLQVMPVEPNAANAGTRAGAYTLVRDALTDAILSFIDGDFSPEESLAAAKEQADASIAEYNSFFGE